MIVKVREKRDTSEFWDIALQAVYKGTGEGTWEAGKGPSWSALRYAGGKGGKDANRAGKSSWQKGEGMKEAEEH